MEKKEATFVLFGGTGDLTKRKLVPAIANLVHEGKIREDSSIIGVSRKNWSHEAYKKFLIDSVERKEEKEHIKKLDIKFFSGDFSKAGLKGLNELMTKCEVEGCNRIYYLATSFIFFPEIVEELKRQRLDKQKKGFTRIVFEKPFGNDLKSSDDLNKKICRVFPEENVFRLDHYLAKETVQNLNVLKFTNPILYGSFGNRAIESIELQIDEELGVGNRLEYYHEAGALKDMIQSHLLQVLSLLLMERPESLAPENIHDKKIIVLKHIEVLSPKEHLLGQYKSYDKEVKEAGFKPRNIETFAKIVLNCTMERWNGVKIILKTGKKLKKKFGQIRIKFRPAAKKFMLGFSGLKDNEIIIDMHPKQNITVVMNTNTPEQNSEVKPVKFEFCRDCEFGPNTPNEYSVLLGEVIKGDKTLFARSDEIKESWRIVEEIENIRHKIRFVYYDDGEEPENF